MQKVQLSTKVYGEWIAYPEMVFADDREVEALAATVRNNPNFRIEVKGSKGFTPCSAPS